MHKEGIEGFFGNPFFDALVNKEKKPDFIKLQLKNCKLYSNVNSSENLFWELSNSFKGIIDNNISTTSNKHFDIMMIALVEAFKENDLLVYFCDDEEEVNKLEGLIKRNQTNSKLFTTVSQRICYFLDFIEYDKKTLANMLFLSIKSKIDDYNNSHILKEMGPFKKVIDEITSGVSIYCYLDFEKKFRNDYSKELIDYANKKHGYYLNDVDYEYLFQRKNLDILSLAVLNDTNFWKTDEYISRKTIMEFAGLVEKYNGFTHATKILDYAFLKACENPICKYLYDHKLPLYYSDDLEMKIATNCAEIIERRFGKLFNFKLSDEEKRGLIYPLFPGYDKNINVGKELFERFIVKAYGDDSNTIFEIFKDSNNLIQDAAFVDENRSKREVKLHDYLEYELVGWDNKKEAKEKFLGGYYKNYESDESVLGRFYYRLYLISKYTKDASEECIFEYLFDMFSMIDEKYGTKCTYGFDQTLRDNSYEGLKNILIKYNIDIDDAYKDNYVIALLDRKCSTIVEAMKFAELEQLGDAIYELAVDNIIFYHPDSDINLDYPIVEKYIKATSQIDVAKKIGLDKLYISKLQAKLNKKFINNEGYEIGSISNEEEKYIADSLEMVIGAIAKEFTVQKALDFATSVILEANEELQKPEFENFDICSLYKSNHDKDYFRKIFPSLFSFDDGEYLHEYRLIWSTVNKILRIIVLGNDTIEKRKMIAHSLHNDLIPGNNRIDWQAIVVNYLYYGIEDTIKKCKIIVESSYNQN